MPDVESAKETFVKVPASVKVYVAPSAECREVEALAGVAEERKGLRADRAVYVRGGVDKGRVGRKDGRTEGVESCSDARTMHPSSALLLACSQALLAKSPSIIPPVFPSGPGLAAVSHVLTTRAVLASSWYGLPDV
jgi:hypothetical protein